MKAFDAQGTGFGSISKTDLENISVVIPPPALVSIFDKVVSPMDPKIVNNLRVISILEDLRDALLPRLMRGDVRVEE